MGGYHAKLSPSGAERWVTCPGSVAMCEGYPNVSNDYSDEGTAAHFLAAECLKNSTHPSRYLASRICVGAAADFDGAVWASEALNRLDFAVRLTVEVDPEFAGYVNHYVQAIRTAAEGGELLVEQALPIAFLTGEDGATGTADAAVFTADDFLEIHDLKFGFREVSAPGNRQLLMYGLAGLEEYSLLRSFKGLRLAIHQPRVSSVPKIWAPTPEELDAAYAEIQQAAKVAMLATEHKANWMGKSTTYLTPSGEGCQWCSAKADCPALAKFVSATVGAEFSDLVAGGESAAALDGEWPAEALSNKMAAIPRIESWCKAVRAKVEADLFSGTPVPGYKVVQGKRGNREWGNPAEVEALFKDTYRLKVEEMYDLKFISPTTAEKLAKQDPPAIGPRQWRKVEALIVRRDGKPSVAPESDPRPALAMGAAAEEFHLPEDDIL